MQLSALHLESLAGPSRHSGTPRACRSRSCFGHPKPHIRRACDQHRIGVGQIPVASSSLSRGLKTPERLPASPDALRRYASGPEKAHRRSSTPAPGSSSAACGPDDRRVAGAAAEVPRQLVVVIGGAVQMRHCHRDHETPACRTRIGCRDARPSPLAPDAFRRLAPDALDRAHRLAIQLGQEQDAGIQGLRRRRVASPSPCKRRNRPRCSLPWCRSARELRAASPAESASGLPPRADRRSVQQKRNVIGHPPRSPH